MVYAITLLMAGVLAGPGAELERLRLSHDASSARVAQVLEQALAVPANAERSDAERCRDAFAAGEWLRAAARLVPDAGYEAEALRRFRALRLDHPDQPGSWLGYIGEARVHRDAGRFAEAQSVLDAVLNAGDTVAPPVRRLAEREGLEVLLRTDPAAAVERARAEDAPWIRARALAALGRPAAAVEAAGLAKSVQAAPTYDRLALIAQHGELTDAERGAWAGLLVGLARPTEALAVLDAHVPPGSRRLYAGLLYDARRPGDAAAVWDALARDDPDDARAVGAAAALAEHLPAAAGIAALRRAVESGLDDDRRTAALRGWVSRLEPAAVGAVLRGHPDLVEADPWLRYQRVVAGSASPPADLEELSWIVEHAQDPALVTAAVLLRAERLRAAPRDALAWLEANWAAVADVSAAQRLRVQLWTDAGITDPAVDAVLADPAGHDAATLLRLAHVLADRYAAAADPAVRTRVVRLAAEAVRRAPGEGDATLAAGKALLRVEAWSDAARMLEGLDMAAARLGLARALLALGRDDEAHRQLDGLKVPEADALRASWALAGGDAAVALTSARAARSSAPPGGNAWWDATCTFVEAQIALGHVPAAAEVLRVSNVLYPAAQRSATLRRRVVRLQDELQAQSQDQSPPTEPAP